MLENTYKNPHEMEEDPAKPHKKSLFSWIDMLLNLDFIVKKQNPANYISYILFTMAIGVFYIGNSHYAEKGHRKLMKLEQEVGDLRTDYTTLRADYMYATKQSEVLKRAKQIGLQESKKAPVKIKIKKGEY